MFLIRRTRMEVGPISGRPVKSQRYWNGDRFSLFENLKRYPTQERATTMLDKLVESARALREECCVVTEDEYNDRNSL